MADDKRNRSDQQSGGTNQGQDGERRKDRKPGSSESPGSGTARKDDEDQEQQE
jgi:hypothetical protein